MNNKLNNYLIINYSKILLNAIFISFCLGLILNLFEEVEFFKNSGESLFLPFILTLAYIPNLIFINLMPFIIFISAMWFFISIKQNNELLTLKVFGYSNAKVIAKKMTKELVSLDKENAKIYKENSKKLIKEIEQLDIKPSMIQPIKEIKSIGKFKVKISLHSEVEAEIMIIVNSAETIQ